MAFNITEDFQYCIWFLPEKKHEWYTYPSGFPPHLSIKTYLDYDDIPEYKHILNSDISVEIQLVGNLYQTSVNDFYALQYLVKPIGENIPIWWPENAHISFRYKYNIPFTEEEIKNKENTIKIKKANLNNIRIQKCSGHYKHWSQITN